MLWCFVRIPQDRTELERLGSDSAENFDIVWWQKYSSIFLPRRNSIKRTYLFVWNHDQRDCEADEHKKEELFRLWRSPTLSVVAIEAGAAPMVDIMDTGTSIHCLGCAGHPFNPCACRGCRWLALVLFCPGEVHSGPKIKNAMVWNLLPIQRDVSFESLL